MEKCNGAPKVSISCVPTDPPIKLPWEYCECGCHGHEFTDGLGMYYWLFNNLKGSFRLYHMHGGYGTPIKIFSSFNQADKYVVERLSEKIERLQQMIG